MPRRRGVLCPKKMNLTVFFFSTSYYYVVYFIIIIIIISFYVYAFSKEKTLLRSPCARGVVLFAGFVTIYKNVA